MDIWLPLLKTWPGALVAAGVLVTISVFIAPLFMGELTIPKNADRVIFLTDWGLSIGSTLIGLGLLWIQFEYPATFVGFGRSRFILPGFFFAFAGFKTFGGAHHWTKLRP